MPRVQKREPAKRDILAQWLWYSENASLEIADQFLESVERTLRLLATQPGSGALIPVRNPKLSGLRRFRLSSKFDKVILFYLPLPNGIELRRVLHGNRDIEKLISEGYFGKGMPHS